MKRVFLTLLVFASALSAMSQSVPQWVNDLLEQSTVIDSIKPYEQCPSIPEYRSFLIYYHQPLSHANPQGELFSLIALLTVDTRKDPLTAPNHVYFSGYEIDDHTLARPDSTFKYRNDRFNEIAHRYQSNFIQLEHRYFSFSSPVQCWARLDDCTSEEAAEDFHAIITDLKKVFKGKWSMSGVSKGGITTALQHMYHPEDADLYVPYSAPFLDNDRDTMMQNYWYNNGLTPEMRDIFMNVRRQALFDREHVYPIYEKVFVGGDFSEANRNIAYGNFLAEIGQFGFGDQAYKTQAEVYAMEAQNDRILSALGMTYCDTVYAFMLFGETFSLEDFGPWLDELRQYPDSLQGPQRVRTVRRHRPFGITRDEWYSSGGTLSYMAYYYQAKSELGYYDCSFTDIVGPEAADEWNSYWRNHYSCMIDLWVPWFAVLPFSRATYDAVTQATLSATKPIYFIYGFDDPWAGAAMKDEFINGTNVRKFVFPNQSHYVQWNAPTDSTQTAELLHLMDAVMGAPAGIPEMPASVQQDDTRKIIRNGQMLIIRGDKTYTLTGVEL